MPVVPEEGVVGVRTWWMDAVETWSGDVGEAEVGSIGDDGLEEAIDIEAANAHALQQLFDKEQIVERLVGCERGLTGKCSLGLRGGDNSDVKGIGNKKIS